jgi:hypothetical protein
MRGVQAIVVIAFAASLSLSVTAKDKPKTYEAGKLVDVEMQDVILGTASIGGIAASIPGRLYFFQIQLGSLTYFAEYKAGKNSYKPEWVVNDPIELRLEKDSKMFLKRPDGKELEVMVVKKVRAE